MIDYIKEKASKIRHDQGLKILESRINENSKPAKTDFLSRVIPAALGGLTVAAGGIGGNKFFKLNIPNPLIAAAVGAGTTMGFLAPDAYNAVLKNKNKAEALNTLHQFESRVGQHAGDIFERYEELSKKAGVGGSAFNIAGKALSGAGKAITTGGQLFMHGLKRVPKSATISEKAFGATTKLVAAGGATLAGKKAYDTLSAKRSEGNYDTFLRNNIMAGNIKSQEVPQSDMAGVQRLGMR